MPLTETSFRRLAQSSPWRFRTLHLTWRPGELFEPVEAWLTRPALLRVRLTNGEEHVVEQPSMDLPREPERDEHGLVVTRPDDRWSGYDDPMWQTYTWVAMLDPRELAEGTTVTDLAETRRHDRLTWWAQLSAVEGEYEPRCGCCPLLWGEVSERAEGAAGGPPLIRTQPDVAYPSSWLIGLDVETGIVVSSEPIGGSRPDAGFRVTIHDVG